MCVIGSLICNQNDKPCQWQSHSYSVYLLAENRDIGMVSIHKHPGGLCSSARQEVDWSGEGQSYVKNLASLLAKLPCKLQSALRSISWLCKVLYPWRNIIHAPVPDFVARIMCCSYKRTELSISREIVWVAIPPPMALEANPVLHCSRSCALGVLATWVVELCILTWTAAAGSTTSTWSTATHPRSCESKRDQESKLSRGSHLRMNSPWVWHTVLSGWGKGVGRGWRYSRKVNSKYPKEQLL